VVQYATTLQVTCKRHRPTKEEKIQWRRIPMTEKITPETYEQMNKEFEEQGIAFQIDVPTQEQIDRYFYKEVKKSD
tara:strand:- start:811 stop:1038 length:228 start_codon:yes stop_codon:yes gene_type:complete